MDHFEMVEKLRQKANVSYEEAKAALEASEWDLLDALVYLEGQGKVNTEKGDNFTTRKEPQPKRPPEQDLRGALARFFAFLSGLVAKINPVFMDVRRNGKTVLSVPLWVLILLMVFHQYWWLLPALVIGLFMGARYSFRGHQAAEKVNQAMDKAAQAAETIKSGVRRDEDGKPEQ